MNRRQFTIGSGALLAGAMSAAEGGSKPSILELRYLRMRTSQDNQMQRTSDFLQHSAMPALQRAGAGPLGFFTSVIGAGSPFVLAAAQFPSLAAWESMREKEAQDPEYKKAREAFNGSAAPAYERLESSLLRCFSSIPAIEVPPVGENTSARIFELRMYESRNGSTLERKVRMFNEGEIDIFRKVGMRPVFFGETLVGSQMPNLVYMLSFDSMAAREAAWSAFGGHPDWNALKSKPGYSDAEIVSNISNSILRALPFSPIR